MSEYKVGDLVIITGTRYVGEGRTAGNIVTLVEENNDTWYFVDTWEGVWSLYDGEFRHLTKLEKTLR